MQELVSITNILYLFAPSAREDTEGGQLRDLTVDCCAVLEKEEPEKPLLET